MSDFNPLSHAQIPTHRSSFDLSQKNLFTAKVGEILPVYWQIAIPGNKYRISSDWFTRTVPVNTAAYTRIKEYYDFYAVPLRLISRALPQAFTQMSDYMTSAQAGNQNSTPLKHVPYTTLSALSTFLNNLEGVSERDDASQPLIYGACKLLDYLNYGSFLDSTASELGRIYEVYTGVLPTESKPAARSEFTYRASQTVNLLPVLAYQKIYYDFYSNSQWERHLAYAYNVDYWQDTAAVPLAPAMFTLRYANYPKDYYLGVLPKSQYGDVAVMPYSLAPTRPSNSIIVAPDDGNNPNSALVLPNSNNLSVSVTSPSQRLVYLNSDLSALSIRATEYLQRWKEIVQFASKDYADQMKAQFGISAPEYMGNHAHYIGGWSSVININEVVNNNLDASNSEASIAGKGVGSQSGHTLTYDCGAEHCVIMAIYHAVPLVDWSLTGQSPQLTVTSITDFPQPAFDQLGMQPVPMLNFVNDNNTGVLPTNVGYNLRYWQWKTNVDVIHGAFRPDMIYQSWAAPLRGSSVLLRSVSGSLNVNFNYRSMKVLPQQLNPIFSPQVRVGSDGGLAYDQLLCNVNFQVYAVQNLDRNGLPY